jgi:Phage-related protein
MEIIRNLVFFDCYFEEFVKNLSQKVKDKIGYVLFLMTVSERIPSKFLKHIEGTDGLFEIRIEFESNIYRIFCCFDDGKLIVLFNGFHKKSQKTSQTEIQKALSIKKEYFKTKYSNQ